MPNVFMIVLRLVHLLAAVFWAGTIFYFSLFFLPRVKGFGPEGGRIMQRLTAPPFPEAMTWAGALVALSGVLLYWRNSGGFQSAWIGTPTGLALTIGGLAGLTAFLQGVVVSRPAVARLGLLGRQVQADGGTPNAEQAAEMQKLAAKLEKGIYRTAYLLLVALAGMAVAPYL